MIALATTTIETDKTERNCFCSSLPLESVVVGFLCCMCRGTLSDFVFYHTLPHNIVGRCHWLWTYFPNSTSTLQSLSVPFLRNVRRKIESLRVKIRPSCLVAVPSVVAAASPLRPPFPQVVGVVESYFPMQPQFVLPHSYPTLFSQTHGVYGVCQEDLLERGRGSDGGSSGPISGKRNRSSGCSQNRSSFSCVTPSATVASHNNQLTTCKTGYCNMLQMLLGASTGHNTLPLQGYQNNGQRVGEWNDEPSSTDRSGNDCQWTPHQPRTLLLPWEHNSTNTARNQHSICTI